MNTEPPNEKQEMQEIESLLRKLPLRRPSVELDGRVMSEITHRNYFPWRMAAAAAVVFAVGTTVILSRNVWKPWTTLHINVARTNTAVPRSPEVPMAMAAPATDDASLYSNGAMRVQRTLAAMSNDGLVERTGDTPVQVFRCQTVKQIFFFDPEHNSRMSVTVPVERVVMIPVQSF